MSRMEFFLSARFASAMEAQLKRYDFMRVIGPPSSDRTGLSDVWTLGSISFELVDEGMTGRVRVVIRVGNGAKWSFSSVGIGRAKKLVRKASGLHRYHERLTTLETEWKG